MNWAPTEQAHRGRAVTFMVFGIILVVIGVLSTIVAFLAFLNAPAIAAASYGFLVLFCLIVLGGGIALLVLSSKARRGS